MKEIWLEKGGQKERILRLKGVGGGEGGGGRHQKIRSHFAVTAFVIMQTAYQNAKNQRSDVQKFQIFKGKHAPGPPTLFCNKRQFYLTNMQKSIKEYQIERFIR